MKEFLPEDEIRACDRLVAALFIGRFLFGNMSVAHNKTEVVRRFAQWMAKVT